MVFIGKNVLENLTVSMYENSKTVYREYIQNAADSIDQALDAGILTQKDAIIEIEIEPENRRVIIRDNGFGVPQKEFKRRLFSIAASEKIKGRDKGFRGIGRLAGAGYCDTLVFRASSMGETIESIMKLDGKALNKAFHDEGDNRGAEEIFDSITTFEEKKADSDQHYFEVIMDGIFDSSDELLDIEAVRLYLESVAPVPYQSFFLPYNKIKKFADDNGFRIDEYKIFLDREQIFKPYENIIYSGSDEGNRGKQSDEIRDIEFRTFPNAKNEIMAWGWFGLCNFTGVISDVNRMRGIRMRKENIQIGGENYLQDYFKSSRGYEYFVGEIFAIDKDLIPIARRDDFTQSDALKYFVNNRLRPWCQGEMSQIPRMASLFRSNCDNYGAAVKKAHEIIDVLNKNKQQNYKDNPSFLQKYNDIIETIKKIVDEIKKKKDKAAGSDNKKFMLKVYGFIEEKLQNSETFVAQLNALNNFGASLQKEGNPTQQIERPIPDKNESEEIPNQQKVTINNIITTDTVANTLSKNENNNKPITKIDIEQMSPVDDNSGVEKSITNLKTKPHKENNKSEAKKLEINDGMIYMKKSEFVDFVSKALSDRLPPEIAKVVMAIIPEVIADVPKSSTH